MDTKRPDSPFFAGKTAKDPVEKMLEKGPLLEKGPKGKMAVPITIGNYTVDILT
jgi:hypothetical protein